MAIPGMNEDRPPLHKWERKPEWPQIAQGVECPVCKSEKGKPCYSLGMTPGTLAASYPRSDWHMERKWMALELYLKGEVRE